VGQSTAVRADAVGGTAQGGATTAGRPAPIASVTYCGRDVERLLVTTHVVAPGEDLVAVAVRYVGPYARAGDVVVLGQKLVSICQGRLVALAAVAPGPVARLLSRAVRATPHGLGLRRPETMEMALREVGLARILRACVAGAVDRVRRRHGAFYRVAGPRVWAIDGPGPETLEPYDRYVVLAPDDPDAVARAVARRLGTAAAVVDVNDLDAQVLGASPGVDREMVRAALRDNPMGQGRARTPIAILRPRRRRSPVTDAGGRCPGR
jgi:hypothetical protein